MSTVDIRIAREPLRTGIGMAAAVLSTFCMLDDDMAKAASELPIRQMVLTRVREHLYEEFHV